MISTKGIETTAGSKILAGYVPVFDATVAARCKEAGLPLLGKTNTDEFAMGSSTENSAFGPSHNPWDPARVPGGSGGGSAAAVSAGLAPWALGSDTGGSIKQPSALCGTSACGRRTGRSAASASSPSRRASTRSGRSRRPSATARCSTRSSPAATRATRRPSTLPERSCCPRARLKGLRVGVPKELNEAEGIEPGVTEPCAGDRARARARRRGRGVRAAALGRVRAPCYYLIAPAEASSNLARYDGVRYGLRVDGGRYDEMFERTRDAGFGDEPKRRMMLGTDALSAGYYDAFYGQAQKVRTRDRAGARGAFERFDVLVSPTSPTVAFQLGDEGRESARDVPLGPAHDPVLHGGTAGTEHPVRAFGRACRMVLQLIGPQLSENTLFRTGHALERALGFDPVPERLR